MPFNDWDPEEVNVKRAREEWGLRFAFEFATYDLKRVYECEALMDLCQDLHNVVTLFWVSHGSLSYVSGGPSGLGI